MNDDSNLRLIKYVGTMYLDIEGVQEVEPKTFEVFRAEKYHHQKYIEIVTPYFSSMLMSSFYKIIRRNRHRLKCEGSLTNTSTLKRALFIVPLRLHKLSA